jgi:CheY-like chemotaxis protein
MDQQAMNAGATVSPGPILLVDDNAGKRLAIKAALAPLGHTIVEAESGLEALRCLLEQDFALILLDIRMPIMDGFVTASLIRTRRHSEHTPIIFVSAHASEEVEVRSVLLDAAGAVAFIAAPFEPSEMRAKVTLHARVTDLGDLADLDRERTRQAA